MNKVTTVNQPKHQIAVITAGWVIQGMVTKRADDILIENAKVIRVWGTTNGLGEIAVSGPTANTIYDYAGTVECFNSAVIMLIDVTHEG